MDMSYLLEERNAMITNGLYKADFKTPNDFGTGVVFLENGLAYGGDDTFYYTAEYTIKDQQINAVFESKRHSSGNQSVFGVDHAKLEVKGTYNPQTIQLADSSSQFQVTLTLLTPAKQLTTAK